MKNIITLLAVIITAMAPLKAESISYGEDVCITIWDNSTAPHSNGVTEKESERRPNILQNVTTAQLLIYEAKGENKSDQAVIIAPGGGYVIHAMDREGFLMAQWFAENGITAAVLKYRFPNCVAEVPMEDAVEGIRVMRTQAERFGFSADKVGIVGSSAGGHAAAVVSTTPADDAKPNFTILFYPVISSEGGVGDKGSFDRLIGKDRTQEQTDAYSADKRVSATTPPAIMFHCDDDKIVPTLNSTLYYGALKEHGVSASLHIYPSGGHGWGMNEVSFQDEWRASLLKWLKELNTEKEKE
ncbi:MAG: alpha/beta hydrolase [Rikenellaceae bacterium]